MNTPHRTRPGTSDSSGEVAQLLQGLEKQKEELGPIAQELLKLLNHLGVNVTPPDNPEIKPSNE